MPRQLPRLAQEFSQRVSDALALAELGEVARIEAPPGSRSRALLHFSRLESLYELAFLKVFLSWESFLEDCFYRLLCGYTTSRGQEQLQPGVTYQPNLAGAERAVAGSQPYVLWHNPSTVTTRCRRFFDNGGIEVVVLSDLARVEAMARIRHRIAHSQSDAQTKFNSATMFLVGRRYPGSRAGRFLRDWVPASNPPVRWLDVLSAELQGLANQIV